jgi:YggT family protein
MDALLFSVADLVLVVLKILTWIIIIAVIMSWLIAFNVVNLSNQFVRAVYEALTRLTEPMFAPVRRLLPNMGGIDLSPLVILLLIFFLQSLIVRTVY